MEKKPIGIFDSGVGGLSVLRHLEKAYPNEHYIYFGDTKNLPYGEKSTEELLEITSQIFDRYEKQNVKAVIMACNTTSATVYDTLKDRYNFKIYPVIQSVSQYLASLNIKRLGVFATIATVKAQKYSQCIMAQNPKMQVYEIACPGWVELVESQDYTSPHAKELIQKNMEKMLSFGVEKIVLGCTHYPYLINSLSGFAPKEMFIDPAPCFIEVISKTLESATGKGKTEFFVSSEPEKFIEASKLFYKITEKVQIADSTKALTI